MPKHGFFFDEFASGQIFTTDKRTISEADHLNFTTSYGFFEPLFMDRTYVESHTPYEGRLVPGALTFSLAEGLTILSGIIHKTGMAFLGVDLKVLEPVFVNDTLSVAIEVLHKRETRKADRGIVTFSQRVNNQTDLTVMEYTIQRMIRRQVNP